MDIVRNIKIEKSEGSKLAFIDFENITFGKQFSDHMFTASYKDGEWRDLKITPYAPITLSPACAAIHYGQSVFEGMKAYKNEAGEIFLFRPEENAKRINKSASRLCMPEVPEELFMEAIKQLITLDSDWVPAVEGCSLYIRPYIFASEELLGVRPATEYKFMIFTSPVGGYYQDEIHVKIETEYSRACEGGVGYAKAAGNYAAALYPAKLGEEQGFRQLIWTDAKEHKYIEESGTMNIMFHIGDKLITPNLDLKTTLAGITRDSVLTLARELGVKVEERKVSVDEVIEAAKDGSLKDVFGTGTAATLAQISSITYKDVKYELPALESRTLSNEIGQIIQDLKRGRAEDTHNWIYKL
ncbi:MAG: branched-chain amino acid aminotransferase [Flavobacteriales bacterium]|nr:branched-chain amino acid aminotransferase [Flavobacteriales bacterium]NQX97944.1 branched-chain amino acid aminotransferase [Flavobacteriales bacterium]